MSSEASSVCLHLLFLLLVSGTAVSHWIVKTLPGFPGYLPFKLETGYISVGEVEFFYYFVESEGYPEADPLLLYINGGPGCSALNGFLYQIGPLKFNISDYTGGLPTLLYEPNTWTKTANVLFLDAPVGAGFSYATTSEAWNASDTKLAAQAYQFLRNWLMEHSNFVNNPVYVGTDSYVGIVNPVLAEHIINGNEAGIEPNVNLKVHNLFIGIAFFFPSFLNRFSFFILMNIRVKCSVKYCKGLVLSCPYTNLDLGDSTRVIFAHRMALISDAMYESAKTSCNGYYVDSTNANCTEALAAISQCIELVNEFDILGPSCAFISPNKAKEEGAQGILRDYSGNFILPWSKKTDFWCKNFEYLLLDIWLNYQSVQDALHVRPGTVKEVFRCNITLSSDYSFDVTDALPYLKNLTNSGLQLIAFSGDHDMEVPHIATETWINALDLTIDTDWRPWFVDAQVAGYTRRYTNSGYRLTYATIKGAGHSPAEYKRKECYDMFQRWIHYYPL